MCLTFNIGRISDIEEVGGMRFATGAWKEDICDFCSPLTDSSSELTGSARLSPHGFGRPKTKWTRKFRPLYSKYFLLVIWHIGEINES